MRGPFVWTDAQGEEVASADVINALGKTVENHLRAHKWMVSGPAMATTSEGTNSASYVSMHATDALRKVPFVKYEPWTRLRIDMRMSFYVSGGAPNCGAKFGMGINGVIYDVARMKHNLSGFNHIQASGFMWIPAGVVPAGEFTSNTAAEALWAITGTGTITHDTNDWHSMSITEMP